MPTSNTDQSRRIEALLGRQRRRIRRRFLLHGLGWAVGVLAAIAVVYYLADRSLRLPGAVRILLSGAAMAYVVYLLRRRLVYPLTRHFTQTDVAVAVERRFPELGQKLVSAFELNKLVESPQPEALRNQSPEMIRHVVAEAAAESSSLPVQQLLDTKRTFRVWGVAACFALVGFTGAVANPDAAAAFLQRVVGLSVPYPRSTMLRVELPPKSPELRKDVQREPGRQGVANIIMATGANLTVTVTADGEIPPEVLLHTSGARGGDREVAMTARAPGRFRFVFQRVDGNFSFYASGGDDDSGDLLVNVATISPPEVANIRATLTYPAYTGLPPAEQTGGPIEALEGTQVQLAVTATADVDHATLTFMDSGEHIDLEPGTIEDDSGQVTAFTGAFTLTAPDRYQIELVGSNELRNPHPGSYSVSALPDYAPVGQTLTPEDDSLGVVLPNGVVPIRVTARDDFGITGAKVNVAWGRSPGQDQTLELLVPGSPAVDKTVLTRLAEVTELLPDGGLISYGETIGLTVELTDNRQPEPQVTSLSRRDIFVVEEADLVRRIAGHFRRVRLDVLSALELQEEAADRTQSLIEELEEGLTGDRVVNTLRAIEAGQARIRGTSGRMHVEFMRSFNLHLFNRQEPSVHAAQVIEMYGTWHRDNPDERAVVPEFYRMLDVERQASRLGAMEIKLDPLLSMIMQADGLFTDLTPKASDTVQAAQIADSPAARIEALTGTAAVQVDIQTELETLVRLLDKWNEFQDVITETRALRDKQQDIHVRTRSIRGDK